MVFGISMRCIFLRKACWKHGGDILEISHADNVRLSAITPLVRFDKVLTAGVLPVRTIIWVFE